MSGPRVTPLLFVVSVLLDAPFTFADSVQVSIGTAVLSGTPGSLAFDFLDADGLVNNSVSIMNFVSDATLASGIATGNVNGDLPGTVTLSDGSFFNELLVPVTLGSSISFTIDYTNATSSPPDSFTFFLLDAASINSLVSTDLLGNALLEVDMTGKSAGSVLLPAIINPGVTISLGSGPPPSPIPEPSSLWLMATAVSALIRLLTRKRDWNVAHPHEAVNLCSPPVFRFL